jgi:hypothetical protein
MCRACSAGPSLAVGGVYAEGAVSGARHCGGVDQHVAHMRQAGPCASTIVASLARVVPSLKPETTSVIPT